jgi:hypothetical protein
MMAVAAFAALIAGIDIIWIVPTAAMVAALILRNR